MSHLYGCSSRNAFFAPRKARPITTRLTCPMGNDENIPLLPGYNLTLPGVSFRAQTLVLTSEPPVALSAMAEILFPPMFRIL